MYSVYTMLRQVILWGSVYVFLEDPVAIFSCPGCTSAVALAQRPAELPQKCLTKPWNWPDGALCIHVSFFIWFMGKLLILLNCQPGRFITYRGRYPDLYVLGFRRPRSGPEVRQARPIRQAWSIRQEARWSEVDLRVRNRNDLYLKSLQGLEF